ncbi:hypothetical protein BDR05DRAFT_626974 [Suillus weaverae]|nr:hypothetical protein BDR05DRAFT_626974 [Suillus weaverae]
MPMPPNSLSLYPLLTFVGLRSNRPSHALARADIDVLDLYDFAHDKDGAYLGEHRGVSEFLSYGSGDVTAALYLYLELASTPINPVACDGGVRSESLDRECALTNEPSTLARCIVLIHLWLTAGLHHTSMSAMPISTRLKHNGHRPLG